MKKRMFIVLVLLLTAMPAAAFDYNGMNFWRGTKSLTSITDLFNGFDRVNGDAFTGGPTRASDNLGALQTAPVDVLTVQGARVSYSTTDGAILGPELIANGDFTSSAGWSLNGTTSISGGVATTTGTSSYDTMLSRSMTHTAGKKYLASIDNTKVSGTSLVFQVGNIQAFWLLGSGTISQVITSTGGLQQFSLWERQGGTWVGSIDNVSIKEITPAWLATAANGSPIWSSKSVRTSKGSVPKFDSTYLGYLNEPAATNIFLNAAAPVTQSVTTTAQTYTISVIGSGSVALSGTATGTATAAAPLTVTATAGTLVCTCSGALSHVQVEAGAFKTSPIVTTGTAATRAATNYSRPTSGALRGNNWGVWGRVVPSFTPTGAIEYNLFASQVDANNNVRVTLFNGSSLFEKRISGVNKPVSIVQRPNAGVGYEYQAFQSSTYGMGFRVKEDGGAWSAWVLKNDADGKLDTPISSTYQIGSRSGINHFAGNFPFLALIQHMDPKTELERLAARYP